jgi:hypothetical protein
MVVDGPWDVIMLDRLFSKKKWMEVVEQPAAQLPAPRVRPPRGGGVAPGREGRAVAVVLPPLPPLSRREPGLLRRR